jgi:hypothetical protein
VGGEIAVADDLPVGVTVAVAAVFHNQADGGGDHFAVVLDADLPFREAGDLRGELLAGPGAVHVGVNQLHDFLHIAVVGQTQVAQFQSVLDRVFGGFFSHVHGINWR